MDIYAEGQRLGRNMADGAPSADALRQVIREEYEFFNGMLDALNEAIDALESANAVQAPGGATVNLRIDRGLAQAAAEERREVKGEG